MKLDQENMKLLEAFINYCINNLGITTDINLKLGSGPNSSIKSAGVFNPAENQIQVATNNRAVADVFRTIAHELTHHRQAERGDLERRKADYDLKLEDEANAMSGRLVHGFGDLYPDIYRDIKS